jgi:transposase
MAKKEQVKAISCDMSPAFIKGVRDNLPKAKITFDLINLLEGLTHSHSFKGF